RANERGYADHGWLRSFHTFSFADYYAPAHMGFRSLRVINEDRVEGGKGFGTHPHRDMEIISYVLSGAIAHKDSMGTGSVIVPGDVQRMSAGTGVTHSEFNASPTEVAHFLQIWLLPDSRGHAPSYEQKHFSEAERQGQLRLVASKDGREGSLTLHQDASLFASLLAPGERVVHALPSGRHAWLHVARGKIEVAGQELAAGDAGAFEDAGEIALVAREPSEILLFDLS
ncbi:MAG TPA: pirin family protein, partial [Polyangiaceae bacterium]|nr:pirin family protein [Polyangiaceae bacterium]